MDCICFGTRNNKRLRKAITNLELSDAKRIVTDKLKHYRYLIPKEIHSTKYRGINHIERKNLSIRTHLKRVNRKTICFSRSLIVLNAVLRIYFWDKSCF
ncbi:MAG: IS1 family transposase [Flavobacterium sp.]|nr:IS1 family transposase [Flavobacterium sp.]